MRLLVAAGSLLGIALSASTASAATLYVDGANATGGGGDGSMARPFATIGAAIAASAAGDTIKVAAGEYDEVVTVQNRTLSLYGGFAGGGDFGTADAAAHVTTIHGTGGDSAVVLVSAGSSVVDGFHITGGVGRNGSGGGGGVFVDGGSVTLSNNVVEGNTTSSPSSNGAGIYVQDVTDAQILNNVVRANMGGRGAGIGGGGKAVHIHGNTVKGNIASGDHGGGMWITAETTVIDGNLVASNSSTAYGGGIVCFGMNGTVHNQAHVTNNVITDNKGFGAVFIDDGAEGFISANLIYRNDNGIYVDGPNTIAHIDGNTIAENGVTSFGPNSNPSYAVGLVVEQDGTSQSYVQVTMENSIMFGNVGGDYLAAKAPSDTTISYTMTEKTLEGTDAKLGAGNLVGNPLFADADHDDYHLQSTAGRWTAAGWVTDAVSSPAIDAGNPASDFSMEPAPSGGRVNMGADADTPEASKSARASGGPTGGGPSPSSSGCGCEVGGGPSAAGLAVALAAMALRRRAARSRRRARPSAAPAP